MNVIKLTAAEKNSLLDKNGLGKEFAPDERFNPVQDDNKNWIESETVLDRLVDLNVKEFLWLKDCPKIEHKRLIPEDIKYKL